MIQARRAEEIYQRVLTEGVAAIEEFIAQRKAEELFLDFKRSADNGSGRRLHQNDRNNLAKAISGFGNSEGGVIIWGIDCSPGDDYADVARAKYPIQDVRRFLSWLEGATSGCTIPPHAGVKNHPIEIDEEGNGFVATLIPKSNHAPHQVVGKMQYYIRAGSDFVPTPHGVLAGMFGRRPQPDLIHMYTIGPAQLEADHRVKCQIGFQIVNRGSGLASDLFMQLTTFSFLGDNCDLAFQAADTNNWSYWQAYGIKISTVSLQHLRLPIEMEIQPITIDTWIGPPFTEDINIKGILGSAQSPPVKFNLHNSPEVVQQLYEDFVAKHSEGTLTKEDRHNFVTNVFGIERI